MAKQQSERSYGKFIRWFWILYFSGIAFIALLFLLISLGIFGFMPSLEELENPKSNLASEIISADQELLGKYYIENRTNINYNNLSPFLINALLATEDIRFRKHSGVDGKAVIRVTLGVLTGTHKGGGSTITQQLAKNLFPRDKQTFIVIQKFKEWITASKLEKRYSKEEILAMYFNTVPFGANSFGIQTASKTFFNKSPDSLKIEEAALLVGMLKAPTYYSPVRNPDNSMKRREVVLLQMKKYQFITTEEYDSLRLISLDMSDYQVQDHQSGLATYLREYLRGYLNDWCKNHQKPNGKPYNLYKDGLKIYTTINSKMQYYAEQAVSEHLGNELQPLFFKHWEGRKNAPFFRITTEEKEQIINNAMKRSDRYIKLKKTNLTSDSILLSFNTPTQMRIFTWKGAKDTVMTPMDSILYYKFFLMCGMMSMEPQTGYVRAYVGGIDYRFFKYDHVIQSKRQVGSTFKPFLYTLAMQEGAENGEFSPCTKVPNVRQSIDLPTGQKWEPDNSSKSREGEMVSLKWALANSVNYISAYLMIRYSPQAVIKMAGNMGITSEIDPVPSIALGTPDISVYEMVGAMSTFANKGVYKEPIFITRIEDKNGNIIENFLTQQTQKEAMNEETAYLMIELMKGVVMYGTGIRLRAKYNLTNPIAGKTGTTQNNSDGWFMGITPNLVSGVWVGCEDRSVHFRSTSLGQGANMALPIWAIYMKKVYDDPSLHVSKEDFEKPANPISVELNCEKYESRKSKEEDFNDIF
ncbi:penicillin-binding protein 1A [candidate division KSB1 bacterium]